MTAPSVAVDAAGADLAGDSTSDVTVDDVAVDDVTLHDDEITLVVTEATAATAMLPEPLRSAAAQLADVAPSGTVPADLVDILESVVANSLAGGRARRRYTAEGEKVLVRLLARTPGGREHQRVLDDVNRALGALAGRDLLGVRVATRVPGSHTVTIRTDGVTLTLGLSGAGVTVESVAL